VRAVDERLKTLETGATPAQKQVVDALTRIEGKIVRNGFERPTSRAPGFAAILAVIL
jgi:hypothetical protein